MSDQLDLFKWAEENFEQGKPWVQFEERSRANGNPTWSARDFASCLGYSSFEAFEKGPLNKAMKVLITLKVTITDHFIEEIVTDDRGASSRDWRLTRFACYLCAMNGDPGKRAVAEAQAYFAAFADAINTIASNAKEVERVFIRGEVSDWEQTLSSTAKRAGVQDYAKFKAAGYRGLYNMEIWQLRKRKQVPPDRSPLDYMDKTELAANLFRVTQTDEKIKSECIRGQAPLEAAAKKVGMVIRETMMRLGGRPPEKLPPVEDIRKVKGRLKASGTRLVKADPPASNQDSI